MKKKWIRNILERYKNVGDRKEDLFKVYHRPLSLSSFRASKHIETSVDIKYRDSGFTVLFLRIRELYMKGWNGLLFLSHQESI